MNIKLKHALLELSFELSILISQGKNCRHEKIEALLIEGILFQTLLKEFSLNISGITYIEYQKAIDSKGLDLLFDGLDIEIEEALFSREDTLNDEGDNGFQVIIKTIEQYILSTKYN